MVAQEFTRGVIRSAERMTYTAVHGVLEGDPALRERYAPLVPRFELMHELALILNRKRLRRGSIDFDLPEPLLEFDEFGEMTGVTRAPRNIAHRLIEEFMLAANEAVARTSGSGRLADDLPHPRTSRSRSACSNSRRSPRSFGYSLRPGAVPVKKFQMTDKRGWPQDPTTSCVPTNAHYSRNYQKLVAKIEGKPEERILSYLMLRSLKQARYSDRERRATSRWPRTSYTHFTSPIRRYPDLIVHRMLRRPHWIDDREYTDLHADRRSVLETERRAAEAERELVEWKKVKFMIDRVGDEFDALIISTTRSASSSSWRTCSSKVWCRSTRCPAIATRITRTSARSWASARRRQFSIGDQVRVGWIAWTAMNASCNSRY